MPYTHSILISPSLLTPYRYPQHVAGRQWVERDVEAIAFFEGRLHVAHDVHLRHLVVLSLHPDDRVIEEVEVGGVELAVQGEVFARVHDVHLSLGQHNEQHAWVETNIYTVKRRLL